MTRLLDEPWVVNEEAERISTHGGLGSIDFNGAGKERSEAMRLVAQTQAMAHILVAIARIQCAFSPPCALGGVERTAMCPECQARAVLRDGGILP